MPEKKESQSPQTFETALARIEEIAARMEANDLPLEELIVAYEEGLRLVKYCGERLNHAEKRIQVITRNAAGEATGTAPLEDETGASTPPESSATEKDAGSPGTRPGGARLF